MPSPDSSLLERVVAEFAAMVRRVGRQYRLSDADVDDVLQEVRIRLWRAVSSGQRGEKNEPITASYVYRTSISAAIDLLRRRRARGADRTVALEDVEEPVSEAPDPSRSVEDAELALQLLTVSVRRSGVAACPPSSR